MSHGPRGRLLTVALGVLVACHPGPEPRHLGESELDRSLACIQRLSGKPIFRHTGVDNRLPIPCARSHAALTALLERDSLRLFDAGEYGILIPTRFLPPRPPDASPFLPQMRWRAIRIVTRTDGPSDLSPERARALAREVLVQSRTIPLYAPEDAVGDGSATLTLTVRFPAGPAWSDSAGVLALVDQLPDGTSGRLAYGTMRGGRFRLEWDSPLLRSGGTVELRDVTGDGRAEIVVESTTGGNQTYPVMVVFDSAGRELTRQSSCDAYDAYMEGFDATDGVCAIKGADIGWTAGDSGGGGDPGRLVGRRRAGSRVPAAGRSVSPGGAAARQVTPGSADRCAGFDDRGVPSPSLRSGSG